MTVVGQISGEHLDKVIARLKFEFDGVRTNTAKDILLVLTELQHRRAAEAGALKHALERLELFLSTFGDMGERYDTQADIKDWRAALSLAASPSSPASGVRVKAGIYVASKVAHAEMWRDLRAFERMPIISTWIDEAGPGESADLSDLWRRCIEEASNAAALLILRRPDEVLKGAWVELGAALASGVPVYAVGIEEFTVAKDKRIRHFPNLVEARAAILSALGEQP